MKAIVHVGAPKAGSSAIQAFLFENATALADQGFHFQRNVKGRGSQLEYPMAALAQLGRLPARKSQRLRYRASSLEEVKRQIDPILADLKMLPKRWPNGTAVFSSEHIMAWLNGPKLIQSLDEIFSEVFDDVRYIMYIRDPFDQVLSQYSETLKRGQPNTLQELIEKREESLLSWNTVSMWEGVVGRDRIDVRLFDKTFLKNGDLIDDFATACGFSSEGLIRPGRVNESLSAAAAEALRMLNQRIPGLHPDGGENPLRQGLVRALQEMDKDGKRLALSPAQWASVDELVRESNESLRAARFPERDELFAHGSGPSVEPDPAALREQALDLMVRLVIDLRLRKISPLGPRLAAKAVTRTPGDYDAE